MVSTILLILLPEIEKVCKKFTKNALRIYAKNAEEKLSSASVFVINLSYWSRTLPRSSSRQEMMICLG